MNPFRRALNQSLHNPKFLLVTFCINFIFSIVNFMLFPYITPSWFFVSLRALLHALALIVTLTLATNVHRGNPFSLRALSRVPRNAPPFLFCYTILSSAALLALSFIRRGTVLYALLKISFFLVVTIPLLVIFLAIMVLLWLQLYAAFCAYGVPHPLKNAFSMLKRPLALPRVYIHLFWILFLTNCAGLWIASVFNYGMYFACMITALVTPFTALLTLSYCDILCQQYHPGTPQF